MDDYVKQLDSALSSGNRKLLTGSGSVSHKQALEKAKAEYRKYQEITLTPVEKAYLESIKEVSKEVKRRQRFLIMMHLSELISREKNPELQEALEDLNEFLCG